MHGGVRGRELITPSYSILNPHAALTNMEFIQMFRRGWSTKGEAGHGYGLYNVRQIVERHGGKDYYRQRPAEWNSLYHHWSIGFLKIEA